MGSNGPVIFLRVFLEPEVSSQHSLLKFPVQTVSEGRKAIDSCSDEIGNYLVHPYSLPIS